MQTWKGLRFLPIFLGILLSTAGATSGAEEEFAFTFTVETPRVALSPEDDETVRVQIEGFHTREERPGYPDVPTRTVLVAIPADATPRLTYRVLGESRLMPARPRPVERVTSAVSVGSGSLDVRRQLAERDATVARVREPDSRVYDAAESYPARVAWLGRTGVLREQRYVQVHVAPVRYAGADRGLQVDPEIELTVHFDGANPQPETPRDAGAFESVYRSAFENYGQGRGFRLGADASSAFEDGPAPQKSQATSGSTTGRRRVVVRETGPVRLDHALFLAEAPEFLSTDPATWLLTNKGEAVPLQIEQGVGDDQLLESGEWVQFFGQALDDEPKPTLAFDNPAGPLGDLYEVRDFSDENVYFLTVELAAQSPMEQVDAGPDSVTPETSFTHTIHEENDNIFIPLPEELWFWLPFTTEGSPLRQVSVDLPGLASGTAAAQVRVSVRGFSTCDEVDPDHQSMVSLTNSSFQQLELPAGNPDNVSDKNVGLYDGQVLFLHDFAWTHSGGDPQLTDPLTVNLEVENLDIPCPSIFGGNVLNEVLLDWIEIDYERSFVADQDSITFEWPDGDAEFEITGFIGANPVVYEITDISSAGVVTPKLLTDATVTLGGTNTVRFHMDNDAGLADGTARRFTVVGDTAVQLLAASDFLGDRVSTLAQALPAVDMVVIAHPDLLDSQCSSSAGACDYDIDCPGGASDVCEVKASSRLQELLDHRALQGVSSRVARMQDVEDEFNDGISGPEAIRNFIAWLLGGGWGSPPTYVMLLGDGSFDYKAGTTKGNYVPTQIMIKRNDILSYYSSDNSLGAVVGADHLTDVIIGRISARTLAEAEDMLEKIVDYEELSPSGPWRSATLLISDRGKGYSANEANEFQNINASGLKYTAGTNYTSTHLRYWLDYCEPPNVCDTVGINQDILDLVSADVGDGVSLTQFMGHGNFDWWSDDQIFCSTDSCGDETTFLDNGLKLPFLTVHTCLSGGFHTTGFKTFGEQWMKKVLGGSMAVFGPSGLGFRFLGQAVIDTMWYDIFGPPKERLLGTTVINSLVKLCGQNSIEGCQFYTLLGDPATVLQLPTVAAVDVTSATASTGLVPSVDLEWTASATAGAGYAVYRADSYPVSGLAFDSFTKIADVAAGTTTYHDASVEVTKTYYYYVVAVKDGFESGWSNFNTTCLPANDPGTPGADCIQLRPLNLDPPATPTGLSATDTEVGGTLDLDWNFNPEPDVRYYTVHFGPTMAMDQSVEVVEVNQTTISGLVDGTPYFVAIEARNTSGTSSPLSTPVIATPNLILGVRPPELIGDLRLARSGADAILTWSPVVTDIYGKPTSVSHYDVFRGTTPQFVPSIGNRIGQPPSASFTDTNALLPAGPDYHYLVRAVDGDGNPGGLGAQLPRGIVDLQIAKAATPGNLVMSWPAVIDDLDGEPTTIDHYAIYGHDQPFTREDIRDGNVGLIGPVLSATSVEITPAAQSRYYSVLAVDVRGNESPF